MSKTAESTEAKGTESPSDRALASDGEGVSPPAAIPDNPPPAVGAGGGFACSWCGKAFDTGRGLGGHRRWCKSKPYAAKVKAGQVPAAAAVAVTEAGVVPPGVAAAAVDDAITPDAVEARAKRAASVFIEAEAAGGGTAAVVGRLEAANIGVADLIAMCCALFLPPELTPAEFRMLQRAWGPVLHIPEWLVKIVVTVMVLGPRIKAHPTLGPWFREQLTGNKAPPPPPEDGPPPIVTPPPPEDAPVPVAAPPSNGAAAQPIARPARARARTPGDYPTRARDINKTQKQAWGTV